MFHGRGGGGKGAGGKGAGGVRAPFGRLRRAGALLAALAGACAALLAVAEPARAQTGASACPLEMRVASDWALKPSGLNAGDRFRLLFVTSTSRDVTSTAIGDYNGFVQTRAAAGHAAVREFDAGFRAVAATAGVNARDNSCMTGAGVPVHWLNGGKVADGYADFYDGGWDDETGRKTESGSGASATRIWTGANSDGTADARYVLGADFASSLGEFGGSDAHPLQHPDLLARSDAEYPFYGLSQVFRVTAAGGPARATKVKLASKPASGGSYGAEEAITVRLTMSESVRVTGSPHIWLEVGSERRKAVYAGAAGKAVTALDFSYTVQPGDADADGVGLCAAGSHADCGRTHLDGGAILAVSDGTGAALAHPALKAQKGHKVSARAGARHVVETVPAAAAHCNPSDNRQLWCGTMTVGVSSTKGGYSRSEGLGAITPGSFTYRGVTVNVTELTRNLPIVENSDVPLQFSLEVVSGAVPAGGLLSSGYIVLTVQIGNSLGYSQGIENPGTKTSFSVPVTAYDLLFVGESFDWDPEGVEVKVWLEQDGVVVLDDSVIVSDPGSDETYGAGDTITVRLGMSQSVFVTGRPHVWLTVGGVRRKAVYSGPVGTATAALDFSYTVVPGDIDTDGVWLGRSGGRYDDIHLNGGSIRAAADETDAELAFSYLGPQSGHKVDAAGAVALFPSADCRAEIRVLSGWALKPTGLNAGDKFHLLFVTSDKRDAASSHFDPYYGFVRGRAAAGHPLIRPFSRGFSPLVSTQHHGPFGGLVSNNARIHTCTLGTGVPIYWLGGSKVADNYHDFYDGSWADRTGWRNENGTSQSRGKVWTGSNDNGTIHASRYMNADTVAGTDGASSTAKPLTGDDGAKSEQRHLYGLSQIFKVQEASDAGTLSVAFRAVPVAGISPTYGLGDRVSIEVTFSEHMVVRGRPRLGLAIGRVDGERDGEYEAVFENYGLSPGSPGSGGSRVVDEAKLIFAFQVPERLHDTDGIEIHSTALRLNGGDIRALSDGVPARWTIAAGENLGGTVNSLLVRTAGVCDRTPAVRDAIVAAVPDTQAPTCRDVTAAQLAGITELQVFDLTSIKVGDFAGLSGLTRLQLYGSGIETLPVGLFDGLGGLTDGLLIWVGLTHLPKDIFRGLGKVRWVDLNGLGNPHAGRLSARYGNRLRVGGLPDGIFEPTGGTSDLYSLFGNPGADSFWASLVADAGPGGTLSAGQRVTLGGPATSGGLWGSNVYYRWRQTDGGGGEVDTVTLPGASPIDGALYTTGPNPTFTVPVLAEETEVRLGFQVQVKQGSYDGSIGLPGNERFNPYSPTSEARFTIRGLAPTGIAVASTPVSGTSYKQGETIEVAVTFGDRVLVDTSQGTPTLALTVGTNTRQAEYMRGTGTEQLVFAWEVASGDTDTDGIAVAANALALNGGAIASVYGAAALLDHDAVAAAAAHAVDGTQTPGFSLADGVCGRTGPVRDKLVDLVNDVAANSAVTNCSLVTGAHLAALTGTLDLSSAGIAALKALDFAGLGGIAMLDLSDNGLTFLPARVFEPLAGLDTLTLSGNPGSAGFAPQAAAAAGDGLDTVSGGTVTLGVEGAAAGRDDPWGSNVTYAWSLTDGTGGTLAAETAARARFTAPVTGGDATRTVRLTVTGAGGSFTGTDDAAVRVAAGPMVERVSFATLAPSAGGPAYTAGARIEAALGFDRKVTVGGTGGTPSVSLTVGTAVKTAAYRGGSGTRELVFAYTVAQADSDTDGVDIAADSLALNGGTILGVSDGGAAALGHEALAGGSGRPVSGAGTPVAAAGICERTAAVEAAILARVRANEDDDTLACGAVTPAMLAAVSGRLDVSVQAVAVGRMTALAAGDFAWLSNVTALDLDRHALRTFPAGVFDDLTALRELSLAYNQTQAVDSLKTLPARLFDRLTTLRTLRLEHNDLEVLPDGIFETLTRLTTLTLEGNPGSAGFLPVARAGPEGGLDAEGGGTVTLGSGAKPGGPWGGNVTPAWRQVSGPAAALSSASAARPTFTAPPVTAAAELVFELTAAGRGSSAAAADRVTVRVAPGAVVTALAVVSEPVAGDSYRRGETVSAAATFGKPVTVTGTPRLGLAVGTAVRRAAYARGSGTRTLVFDYTVAAADSDTDGIAAAANALELNGGAIADADGTAAALGHAALAAQPDHRVDGSRTHSFSLTAGICGRTPAVRDVLLARVRAATVNVALGCHQVTDTHLGALAGTLHFGDREIRTLKAGDFGGLGGIAAVDLSDNELAGLPSGAFAGLDDTLTRLDLSDNELAVLPAGVFEGLTGLAVLGLSDNGLAALPARVFQALTGLTRLELYDNPGSARFRPVAKAGPAGGIVVARGGSVTLGVEGAAAGRDDPWGTNVTYAWEKTAGAAVTYATGKGLGTARPAFTAPSADGVLGFTLTVTGKGGGFAAADTVEVSVHESVDSADGTPPALAGAAVDGPVLTLSWGEDLKAVSPVPASGKGPVWLAILSDPGLGGTTSTARVAGAQASGRTVALTLEPPAEYGQLVTLSYRPGNAAAASRVQDAAGNEAAAFVGQRVRNDTPEGPLVAEIAFAGAAGTYKIGGTVGIDVTFSEPVTVSGAPTLALVVGAATRKAVWKPGQPAGAVHRFDYAVAEGDEDTDGIAVAADGLAAPAGSTIMAQGEAVILRHGSLAGPARLVDGVRPTASSAQSQGPSVNLVWNEPLDGTSAPAGAGGFTVAIAGATDPAVTAAAVTGSVVTLTLNTPIALGTTGVTVSYTPAAVPIRDAAGNAAAAFASPLAVDVAQDTTLPALTAAAVDGDRLTLSYNEPLKVTSPTKSGTGAVYTVGVSGGSAFTLSEIRAGVGPGNTRVTMRLEPPAEAGQTVTAAYTAANATAATRVQDLAGNEAAAYTAATALTPSVTVGNDTGAPTLALSKAQATEGDDAEVTLTLSTGGTAYATDRTFTIAVESGGTAAVTEDWTLSSTSMLLPAGAREAAATLTVVDDARLEGAETVSFKASSGGAETAAVELAIADDDRAVLVVTGPDGPVTEGAAIELRLRLEPHPDNLADVSTVADDACLVDFPVTAVLTRSGGTAAALPDNPVLETEHAFAATAFDACTREAAVSVPTREADGVWAAGRALSFVLAPQAGSDVRIEAGQALAVAVRDSTPGGPVVTGIAIAPVPPEASDSYVLLVTREEFKAVPDGAVHGPGAALTFTLTFDHDMTVTPHAETEAQPELALDIFGRERRARYTGPVGSPTRTLTFAWTVERGDYDPDGLEVRRIVANGAAILDGQGRAMAAGGFPAGRFAQHRVRGGFFTMRLEVAGPAREGEPVRVRVVRDGGSDEQALAVVRATDSGAVEGPASQVLSVTLEPEGSVKDRDGDWRVGAASLTVPGDGEAGAARELTFRLELTDRGSGAAGVTTWYDPAGSLEAVLPVADAGLATDAPELSVSWADAHEATGAALVFEVRLRPEAAGEVRVAYATRDGSAAAGADYTAAAGTLVFSPGEVRKEVAVAVLADSHDEGAETMTLVLSNPQGAVITRGEGIGTIRNRGPLQKAWIGRFGRTVAEQVLEAIEGRMRAAPAPGVEFALVGERIGWSAEGGEDEARQQAERLAARLKGESDPERAQRERGRAVTPRDLLTGSSFALSGERSGGGLVSLWGRGAISGFDGREGALSLDGEVATVMLGADWTSRPGPASGVGDGFGAGGWTTGLILSHSTGGGDYRGEGPGGRVEAEQIGLFPWARHALTGRLEAWGAAGYGAGTLTVVPKRADTGKDGAAMRAGLDLWVAAAGLRRTMLDRGAEGLTLTGKTDAMVVQTASGRGRAADGGNLEPARATVSRLRLALEASRPIALGPGRDARSRAGSGAGSGAVLTPGLEVGVRHDDGDAETGFGLDLGGGLALSDPARGIEAEIRGRGLLSHESRGFRERGFSGSLAWNQKPDSDRGAALALTQTFGGASSGGAGSLFSRAALDGLAARPGPDPGSGAGSGDLKSRRQELRAGYGFPAFGDRFTSTPEAGIELADTGLGYRLGWRLARTAPAPGTLAFDIGAEAIRREPRGTGEEPEHEIGLGFGWRLADAGGSDRAFEARIEARRRESGNDNTLPEHEVGLRLTARF